MSREGLPATGTTPPSPRVLERKDLPSLFRAVATAGYRVLGPRVDGGAIVLRELRGVEELPEGWTDEQGPGSYRLHRVSEPRLFHYTVGPQGPKGQLFPPHERLWSARRNGDSFSLEDHAPSDARAVAVLGVRACELAALAITDKVFQGGVADPGYRSRRARTFVVAVECSKAGPTCFCASMGTGPEVSKGYDLSLTELLTPSGHAFLVEAGSERGEELLEGLPLRPARPEELEARKDQRGQVRAAIHRQLPVHEVHDLLLANMEHHRWAEAGQRCLACTNCTSVCPTCFCSTTEEVPSLSADRVERWRRWDSCFNAGFSMLHGTPVRGSTSARYRHWVNHKLATWWDQFGTQGCVGCGRCITWCPVGIDLTEEVAAIAKRPVTPDPKPEVPR